MNSKNDNHSFTRLDWESNFFGRPIFGIDLLKPITREDTDQLYQEMNHLGVYPRTLFQVRVRSTSFDSIHMLEDIGFRLVDSRLEFATRTRRLDYVDTGRLPVGQLRWFQESDLQGIEKLTSSQFSLNASFKSRFNNRRYFTQAESHAYYMAWHQLALKNEYPLFCVWENNGNIVGFYSIIRQPTEVEFPLYKVGLAAVEPDFRSLGAQNQMQYWIFSNSPDSEWTTINSPALTNISGLKNNIRAAKELSHVEFILFNDWNASL